MEIGRSFSYMFEDKDWLKKIAIGGVLNIVPVLNFVPYGYSLRVLKNVSERKDETLPEWDDWGGDFVRGLVACCLAPLIYWIPALLLGALAGIVSAIAGSSSDAESIASICNIVVGCISTLYGLIVALILPAGIIKYAQQGQFGVFFRFGELVRLISVNVGAYIVALLMVVVAFLAASIVGTIACVVGLCFTTFWATLVAAHLFAQVAPAPAVPGAPGATSYGDLSITDLSTGQNKPA